jgi:hypothetical protein
MNIVLVPVPLPYFSINTEIDRKKIVNKMEGDNMKCILSVLIPRCRGSQVIGKGATHPMLHAPTACIYFFTI